VESLPSLKEPTERDDGHKITQEQIAVIIAMSAEGHATRYIAERLGIGNTSVWRYQQKHESEIKALGATIIPERIEDYTINIKLVLEEIQRRLTGPQAAILKMDEMTKLLKALFDKRQLLLREPTGINASIDSKEMKELDGLALKENFENNLIELNQKRIKMLAAKKESESDSDEAGDEEVVDNGEVL